MKPYMFGLALYHITAPEGLFRVPFFYLSKESGVWLVSFMPGAQGGVFALLLVTFNR